mmetsp:Transcript_18190/g.42535  ORF Transcript_18190/g.42535 Transcript_18190/m.42535 type:complete len:91 (-) Transcript_18190:236-508(-)
MCPLRLIAMLLMACGLVYVTSPVAAIAAGGWNSDNDSKSKSDRSSIARRILVWVATVAIVGLHADLLLSLGYTRCAFQGIASLHRMWLAA